MFVHLRLHTEFSIVDGTTRVDGIAALARADAQVALAITDFNNLFGAIKFYRATRQKGVKPILGAELLVEDAVSDGHPARVLLLVQDRAGYLNLCELLSRAYTRNVVQQQAMIKLSWLPELAQGLILLSGAQAGPIGQLLLQGDSTKATQLAAQLALWFPRRFYLEVQRCGRMDESAHVAATVGLAAELHLPVVATHPVQFATPDEYEAHEARVCIAEGEMLANPRRVRRFTREQYFKSQAEMEALFADLPAALANTVEIAKRCNLTLQLGKAQLPDFPTPPVDGQQLDTERYFRHVAKQGLEARLAHLFPEAQRREQERQRYLDRLEFEIATILEMGFPGYFLIVGDFINWAKTHGCPVGPGRGSGAGSLVAYALGITDLDPLEYQLLFERFLNPERVSMPDFDIDFCQANRDRVIEYVKDKYGKDAVSQIATFGTMAARAAIRDVGRVLDMSYTFCDGISKLVPNKPGTSVTLQKPPETTDQRDDKVIYALEAEPQLAEREAREDDVRTLLELARQLEGVTRNVGMHAGGVLIAPGKLTDFCPLYQQSGSAAAVSQFDKDDVEAAGLVKFDFLGLATLTILEHAAQWIRQRHPGQQDFSFDTLPLDDATVYRLFQEGRTEAVFQFESRGMQAMLRDAKPSRLEDLIAMNALFRPGPMDLIPTYIARKHGREPVDYPDPRVEGILAETYGIMVYQEQVMQMAQILGGYSLGRADLLRRAMGKKKAEEMAKHRDIFRDGAAKNGLSQTKADEVFDLMEKFAGYGFNKSHSAAYALLAYQTAWLKVHYPAEFYCANMTVEMGNTDRLHALLRDARDHGMRFDPPDVNRSTLNFEPVSANIIRYALGAIKGTGAQAIDAILSARNGQGGGPRGEQAGPFRSLFDFCARVDRGRVNKRTVEALIRAGAFDTLERHRASLLASVESAFDYATQLVAHANQGGLFDDGDQPQHGSAEQEPALAPATPWNVREQLTEEKAALGLYLTGHLFDEAATEVRRFVKRRIDELIDTREPQLLAGIVCDLRVVPVQRGRLALFRLDDGSGVIEARAEEALWQNARLWLKDDALIIVSGQLKPDRFSGGLQLNVAQAWSLELARCHFGKHLRLELDTQRAPPWDTLQALLRTHAPQREFTPVGEVLHALGVRAHLRCTAAQSAEVELEFDERARFFPSDAALQAWATWARPGSVALVYE